MDFNKFEHLFLVEAKDIIQAQLTVKRFLQNYQLIRYDHFEIETNKILTPEDSDFYEELEKGLATNRSILENFLRDLETEGYSTIKDLTVLPQGYLSKMFHLVAHFLDGFFSIDSYFYNLIEDSHWISKALMKKIEVAKENYFLIKVRAYLKDTMYQFENLSPRKFLFKI